MDTAPIPIREFENFRRERVAKLIELTAPVQLHSGLHTILHVIPLTPADISGRFKDLSHTHNKAQLRSLFGSSAVKSRRNSDGYLICGESAASGLIGSYLQLFANGALESVNTFAERDRTVHKKQIPFLEVELRLFQRLPEYFRALEYLGVPPPVALGLTLTGVEGYSIEIPLAAAPSGRKRSRLFRNETLFLPDVWVANFESDLSGLLKPALDAAWRAGGYEASIFYEDSAWVGLAKAFPKAS